MSNSDTYVLYHVYIDFEGCEWNISIENTSILTANELLPLSLNSKSFQKLFSLGTL